MQARPSLERGIVEEILDANLLLEPYNSEMMLKMGQLGLRCVVKVPKKRPTMTQVWQELEAALYSAENSIHNQPRWRSTSTSQRPTDQGNPRSTEHNDPQSLVSVDGLRIPRLHGNMSSISFQSTSLRCFEASSSSVSIDIDEKTLGE